MGKIKELCTIDSVYYGTQFFKHDDVSCKLRLLIGAVTAHHTELWFEDEAQLDLLIDALSEAKTLFHGQ